MNAPDPALAGRLAGEAAASPGAAGEPEGGFDWQACWHPVAFTADLPAGNQPLAFSLHDEPLVLFRAADGALACVEDRCPHRMARLSAGRVVDGRLECGYHGWQFGADGACVHMPQLAPGQPLPPRACVPARAVAQAQGLVWVWAGEPALARPESIPTIPALDAPGVRHVDYATDLPYDQGYLIENVIDVAHIHIAHDGMRGGGHRHLALPLVFDVLEDGPRGVRAAYRSVKPGEPAGTTTTTTNAGASGPLASAQVAYRAPGLIHYTSHYRDATRIAGLALYALPLGRGRCRLLYRKYSNFYPWRERIKPRWLEHWTQNTILRQDMDLIVDQYTDTERSGAELRTLWLPLKSSDTLVLRYRQWVEKHPPPGGAWRGFAAHASPPAAALPESPAAPMPGTFALHTRHCAACQRALRTARRLRAGLGAAALLALPLVPLAPPGAARVSAFALYAAALAGVAACTGFMRRFG